MRLIKDDETGEERRRPSDVYFDSLREQTSEMELFRLVSEEDGGVNNGGRQFEWNGDGLEMEDEEEEDRTLASQTIGDRSL